MRKSFRPFLVVKSGSMGPLQEDGSRTTSYHGGPYTEDSLREWAAETFDTDETATLEDIARAIKADGWLLYEGIWPSVPESEKSQIPYDFQMHRIAEAFQGDLEADAESIAEACKGIGARVVAKTMISEVKDNKAVITITVTPKPEENK